MASKSLANLPRRCLPLLGPEALAIPGLDVIRRACRTRRGSAPVLLSARACSRATDSSPPPPLSPPLAFPAAKHAMRAHNIMLRSIASASSSRSVLARRSPRIAFATGRHRHYSEQAEASGTPPIQNEVLPEVLCLAPSSHTSLMSADQRRMALGRLRLPRFLRLAGVRQAGIRL